MISLTDKAGTSLAVNPMTVFYIAQDGDGTRVTSASGVAIFVKEPFEEVQRRMKAWAKG